MSQKIQRPEISLETIPNLPWSFIPGKYDAVSSWELLTQLGRTEK